MHKRFNRKIKRIVVKAGTSILANRSFKLDNAAMEILVEDIANLNSLGVEVILVSSGAVVSGMSQIGIKCRPQSISCLQATAACGQVILMHKYNEFFKQKKLNCGQILLTWDDFSERSRYINAKNTILSLLEYKAIPIINENDTVSTEEIKFGDNDRLSALVACMVEADLLIMLSDVDGFYKTIDGKKYLINEVREISKEIESLAEGTKMRQISKGGMKTKLEAAKIAIHSGIDCIIANGKKKNILTDIISGKIIGTHFPALTNRFESKKHWIAFSAKAKGKIVIDDGAKEAILNKGKSLLNQGIKEVSGNFLSGYTVNIVDSNGNELGKGIVNYSRMELEKHKKERLSREVIHRDNLVLY